MSLKLRRLLDEPIMTGNKENFWEAASCYNAASIKKNNIVHLFYRATDKNANGRECDDYLNYIGHATSQNGVDFTRNDKFILGPIENSVEQRGCEDPRVTKIDDTYYMLYTGFGNRYPGDFSICMASSKDLINWDRQGVVLDESNKDAALFPDKIDGEYVLLHRRPPHIWISFSKDLKNWERHQILAKVDPDSEWENCKIGIAGPPLKTEKGYVLIYHGVSEKETNFGERGDYKQYALGIMLLDLKDPTKVIYRQKEPILIPELIWEKEGGYVPNVVFSCGQVIMNDDLYVYYAGADKDLGIAICPMDEIMALFDKSEK